MSFSSRLPFVTASEATSMAIGLDALRRAYLARENLRALRPNAVVWIPSSGNRAGLAYAAGASVMAANVQAQSTIALGGFEEELAILQESALRRGQNLVVNSSSFGLAGQAISFAGGHHLLLGEELFVGGAYLEPQNIVQMSSLIALDVLRWAVILLILLGVLANVAN